MCVIFREFGKNVGAAKCKYTHFIILRIRMSRKTPGLYSTILHLCLYVHCTSNVWLRHQPHCIGRAYVYAHTIFRTTHSIEAWNDDDFFFVLFYFLLPLLMLSLPRVSSSFHFVSVVNIKKKIYIQRFISHKRMPYSFQKANHYKIDFTFSERQYHRSKQRFSIFGTEHMFQFWDHDFKSATADTFNRSTMATLDFPIKIHDYYASPYRHRATNWIYSDRFRFFISIEEKEDAFSISQNRNSIHSTELRSLLHIFFIHNLDAPPQQCLFPLFTVHTQ